MQELNLQLKEFGLNPEQWALKPMEYPYVEIEHSEDKDYKYLGKLTDDRNSSKWECLYLLSV